MANRFVPPVWSPIDKNSHVYPGALLETYVSGTTTPQATFTDSALTIPHPNPVVADAKGQFPEVFLIGVPYKMILKDAKGAQVGEFDPVTGVSTDSPFTSVSVEDFTATASQTVFTLTQSTYDLGNNRLRVYINGVYQNVVDNYAETSTSSITFTSPLDAGDFVVIINNIPIDLAVDLQLSTAVGRTESETFTATAGQTIFTLTESTYTPGNDELLVYINGAHQTVVTSYTETSSSTIAFVSGLTVGDIVTIVNIIPSVNANEVVFTVPVNLPSYTVAMLPTLSITAGSMAYATDETGGAVPVFYDGTDWRRVTDRDIAS